MEIDLSEILASANDWATIKLPDPDLYQFWEGCQKREIWIEDPICWETVSRTYKYLRHLNPHNGEVRINIMSPGGELDVMFAMYDIIKNAGMPIHTHNVGRCHSAAFIIFLAGHYRTMTPYGTFVAHEGSSVLGGTFRETKAAMAQYEKDVEKMCKIIADETNLEFDYIKQRFAEESDWYIDYEEAVAGGIVREPKPITREPEDDLPWE